MTQMKCILGYSGSRYGMNNFQKSIIRQILESGPMEVHHGDCVGGDSEIHNMAYEIGQDIVIHPPLDDKLRAWCTGEIKMMPLMPYKARNCNIVKACTQFVATPYNDDERGGTWNAIGWARRLGKPCTIIYRSGKIDLERTNG